MIDEGIVRLANGFYARLMAAPAEDRMAMVWRLIEDAEVVYAIWQDDGEPEGIGYLLIKGAVLMRQIIAENRPRRLLTTGIKCDCLEQAAALQWVAFKKGLTDLSPDDLSFDGSME
jgi:hypothetical protein